MPPGHLFSTNFWRSYWISIRRSKRDRRDLWIVLRITALLVFAGGYYGSLLWNMRVGLDAPTSAMLILSITVFSGVVLYSRISNRGEKRAAEQEALATIDPEIRRRIAHDGLCLAVLLARAGSEQFLREKTMPEGFEMTTRRMHLDQFQKQLDWIRLPAKVRALLLAGDGHWTDEDISSLRAGFETLRCIRWAVCFDADLASLNTLPRMDYAPAQQLVEQSESFLGSNRLLPVWDLRVERNQADAFFSRCYAELIHRGVVASPDDASRAWASDVTDTMTQPHIRDVLAGIQTVSELDNGTLMYLALVALHRHKTLQLLMRLSDGEDAWAVWETHCLPHFHEDEASGS